MVVRSNKNKVSLPFNANLGFVRPQTSADQQVFQDAADHTADQLASSWLQFAESVQNNDFYFPPSQDQFNATYFSHGQNGSNQTHGSHSHMEGTHPPTSKSWQLHAQTAEMAQAGLDSSILSPFLSEPDLDHPNAMPPPEGAYLDPYSDEYFDQLVTALELDGPMYSHVDPNIMSEFKQILRKYPTAFHLPGTPLGTIKSFSHNIDTGDSPPVYQLPYKKSPVELCAIKKELQRMLSMKIIQPSHSPYGSPCILVRKPLEKGKPHPLDLSWTIGISTV